MYTDDLISREELNQKLGPLKEEIAQAEKALEIAGRNLTKGEQLEVLLRQTFKTLEDVADVSLMTNAQLRRLVDRIEVDREGNVDIFLRLPEELGLDHRILLPDATT